MKLAHLKALPRLGINPASVETVDEIPPEDGEPAQCRIGLVSSYHRIVHGTYDEVTAALEFATAPPAPAPVVVGPSDLERAAWCTVWLVLDGFTIVRVRFTAEGESVEAGSISVCKALGLTWAEAREQADAWIVATAPLLGRLPHVDGGVLAYKD